MRILPVTNTSDTWLALNGSAFADAARADFHRSGVLKRENDVRPVCRMASGQRMPLALGGQGRYMNRHIAHVAPEQQVLSMSLVDSVRRLIVPIHKEGYPFIAVGIVSMVVLHDCQIFRKYA